MTAIYPDDAVYNINSFSTIASIQYNGTGSTTEFVLPTTASTVGQVLAFSEGVLQEASTYDLSAPTGTQFSNVIFTGSLSAANLTLKVISVPNYFYSDQYSLNTALIEYSTTPVIVRGNSYSLNGSRTTFALPVTATSSNKDSVLIFRNGLSQVQGSFTFPSATLGIYGVDLSAAPAASGTLTIRIYDTTSKRAIRSVSMEDKKPDKGFSYTQEPIFKGTSFIAGYEKRRLITRRMKRKWSLSYTNITGIHKEAIEDFYLARSGGFEAFSFDLDHLNEQGVVTVTFDSPPTVTQVLSGSLYDITQNFYNITMTFKEVDD